MNVCAPSTSFMSPLAGITDTRPSEESDDSFAPSGPLDVSDEESQAGSTVIKLAGTESDTSDHRSIAKGL